MDNDAIKEELLNEDIVEEDTDNTDNNEEKDIEEFSIDQIDSIHDMLDMVKDTLSIFKQIWEDTQKTYELTVDQMTAVSKFNKDNREPQPEGYDEENIENEEDKWDPFNGIIKMTKEDVINIFGEGHKIIGIDHQITIDHIKEAAEELSNYITTNENYKQMNRAYLMLIDLKEEYEINKLQEYALEQADENEKNKLLESINKLRSQKNIDFLSTSSHLKTSDIDYIIKAYNEEKKIQYLMNRTIDKIERLGLSKGMLLEFNEFEKRYLPEKYHKYSNMLLVYILKLIAYSSPDRANDEYATNARSVLLAVDSVVRDSISKERKAAIINNIINFEEMIIDRIEKTK